MMVQGQGVPIRWQYMSIRGQGNAQLNGKRTKHTSIDCIDIFEL